MKISIDDAFQPLPVTEAASDMYALGRKLVGRQVPRDLLAVAEKAASGASVILRRPGGVWEFVELLRFRFHGSPELPGLRTTIIVRVHLFDLQTDVKREEEEVRGFTGLGDYDLAADHIAHDIAKKAYRLVQGIGSQCKDMGARLLVGRKVFEFAREERKPARRRA